jgi:ubiquitin-protein ligase
MYVTPSPDNMMEWHAVFFIHQGKHSDFMFRGMLKAAGYYANAILKFKILFPVEYPNRPPVVQFTSDVFHPLIRQKDGIMNIKTRFRTWRSVQRDNDAS